MFSSLNPLIAAVSTLIPGLIIGYLLRQIVASKRIGQAESRAQAILNEAKSKSQDLLLESKNKSLELLEDAKKEEKERNSQLVRIENLLTKKEDELEEKGKELTSERERLKIKAAEIVSIKTQLEQDREKQIHELERVSGLDKDKAKGELMAKVEEDNKDEIYKKNVKA